MAELVREGDTIVLRLSTIEKLEGVHGDIEVPVSAIQSVTALDDVIHAVHGLKMPGSQLPGVFAMGTFLSKEGTTFVMIHHHNKRGLKLKLNGTSYDALIVGVDDPEQVAAGLGFEFE
ncbi:PH domain-containing protein [Sulfoacidibacillus ferrooxidans]|uniref:Uncharacterized protein n=1 Tax=Sulfoacidibacillus ferrooxidans TaxID=2005001 RepID=A0A9X2ACG7_9BACL|nr:PH domain-containing protein [Sulfoacidibacillus ferrooxidans]MCI0184133.1 hypothetical protein [Sulfoacidibacillus ferrooxidans]